MEFLKAILGEELFKQLEEKINAHNGNEANAQNQVKIGNLASGEYVGKGKHDSELEKLNTILSGKETELKTANDLIAELQKGTKGNAELQGIIDTYKNTTVPDLQRQLAETKSNYALKFALQTAEAVDVDYMTFKVHEKLKEQGKTLELDENENIKGWDDLLSGLKVQHPTQFKSAQGGKKVEVLDLPKGNDRELAPKNLAEALQSKYENNTTN